MEGCRDTHPPVWRTQALLGIFGGWRKGLWGGRRTGNILHISRWAFCCACAAQVPCGNRRKSPEAPGYVTGGWVSLHPSASPLHLASLHVTKPRWREWIFAPYHLTCRLFCTLYSCFCCCIPILSPGLIVDQKAFLVGLFSGKIIFGGAYYWREFCISKWVGLDW